MRRSRLESLGVSLPKKKWHRRGSIYHAVKAGNECLSKSQYNCNDVQVLVNTGVHRDEHLGEPALAAIIQKKMGMNAEFQRRPTFSFDILSGGCGMLHAAHILTNLMNSGTAHVGMVVSSEANADRHPAKNYSYPESGAAVLMDISPRSDVGFGSFLFKTFTQYANSYTAAVDLSVKKGKLYIKGEESLEDAYLTCAPEVVDEYLQQERINKQDIDWLVPSQISPTFIQELSKKLDFPQQKIIDTTNIYEDTLTTSFFLALDNAYGTGKIQRGQKVLFLSFGAGVVSGAALYYF